MKPDEEEIAGEEELPSAASDVPLSRTGSLYLLAAMAASSALFDAPALLPPLRIVPDFAAVVASSIGDAATGSTGMEPEYLIDAVLFLGFFIIKNGRGIPTDSDSTYHDILQRLSLLSANIPSPGLRYHAHLLTSTILHSHSSDHVRLSFIRDTLEHCPYENLKGSAVGWLKDEIIASDKPVQDKKGGEGEISIFSTPEVLTMLVPFLFPNTRSVLEGQSIANGYATFQAHQAFYLAVVNLLYLLVVSPTIFVRLQIAALLRDWGLNDFLENLSSSARKFQEEIDTGGIGYGDDEGKNEGIAGMELVQMSVEEVVCAIGEHDISTMTETGVKGSE